MESRMEDRFWQAMGDITRLESRVNELESRLAALEALQPEERFRHIELAVDAAVTDSEGWSNFKALPYPGEE